MKKNENENVFNKIFLYWLILSRDNCFHSSLVLRGFVTPVFQSGLSGTCSLSRVVASWIRNIKIKNISRHIAPWSFVSELCFSSLALSIFRPSCVFLSEFQHTELGLRTEDNCKKETNERMWIVALKTSRGSRVESNFSHFLAPTRNCSGSEEIFWKLQINISLRRRVSLPFLWRSWPDCSQSGTGWTGILLDRKWPAHCKDLPTEFPLRPPRHSKNYNSFHILQKRFEDHLPIFQLEIAETPDGEKLTAVGLVLQLQRLLDVVQGGLGQAALEKIFRLTDEDELLRYHGEAAIHLISGLGFKFPEEFPKKSELSVTTLANNWFNILTTA